MQLHTYEWNRQIAEELRPAFQLTSKTVFHVGEVLYSDGKDPVSAAVNQVFKIEKLFSRGELGCTDIARVVASPFFSDLGLQPATRASADLPGLDSPVMTWLVSEHEVAHIDVA